MILFCEDCGHKNDLEPAAFAGGRAVFVCCGCGYNNAYNLTEPQHSPDSKNIFLSFFDALQSLSGVIGAFIYHGKKGLVGENMPQVLTREDIEALGKGLALCYSGGRKTFPDVRKMTVMISDKYFSVFHVHGQMYAVIVTMSPSLPDKAGELVSALGRREHR